MKTKILLIIAALLPLLISPGHAQKFSHAGEYMGYISGEYEKIDKDTWDYIAASAHGKSLRKVENKRRELIGTIEKTRERIKKLTDWDGDGAYRDTVVSYLQLSLYVIKDDYGKILDMEEIAEQSYDNMEAYILAQQKANDKLEAAFELLRFEQKRFADDNNVKLVTRQDELDVKLERAGEVFKYYNKVYLIFFKPYKQEFLLLDAMQKGDISAMEQIRNSLAGYAAESIARLDTVKSFRGDKSIITASIKLLEFYKKEAGEKVQPLIDFYLKKDQFGKGKASFEAIPQNSRTQADINAYNKLVDEFNTTVAEYNKLDNELNNERQQLLNTWNVAIQNFLNRHVPSKK